MKESIPTYWKRNTLLIISASANNDYFLKVAEDNKWPTKIINKGYTTEEFNSWAIQNNFFNNNPNLFELCYWTGNIPYELEMMRRIKINNSGFTLEEVLNKYISERSTEFDAQSQLFYKKYIDNEVKKNLFFESVMFMVFQVPLHYRQAKLLNKQVFSNLKNNDL